MKIAFLGLGQMGAAVAARLLGTQHEITVWNRSKAAAGPLVQQGASAAQSPEEAVRDADFVFTMFTDDAATRQVMLGKDACLGSMKAGAVHVSLSTISVALARELTQAHHDARQHHVGSPVFGRPRVAAEGKLWLAVGGDETVLEKLKPLLQSFSRGMSVVGPEPWQAHALKLGGNFMITATIQMMAEAMVFAKSQGIEPELFMQTVNSALFQSQFVENYARTMLHPPQTPGASVSLGIKDTGLFREAAAAQGVHSRLADYLASVLSDAEAAGWKDEDWAVGQYRVAQNQSRRG